jgi:hypothetical protein
MTQRFHCPCRIGKHLPHVADEQEDDPMGELLRALEASDASALLAEMI